MCAPPPAPANIVPAQQGSEAECIAGVGIPPGSSVKWVPLIVPPYGSTPYLAVSLLHVRILVSRGVLVSRGTLLLLFAPLELISLKSLSL